MKPLVSKAAFGYLPPQCQKPNFSKNVVLTHKRSQRKQHQGWESIRVSRCQSAKQLLGEKTSLSQYYSLLTLTWWLRGNRINQPSDVDALCSAASSLCPSSLPPFLRLSSISFQTSTSLIRLTWENCSLAAAPRLSDRSSTLSLLLLFCSPVTCDSNTLDLLPTAATAATRPPLKPSWGVGEGSGMSSRWHDSHSQAAQRDKFAMFKGNSTVCVSKRSVQI